MEIQSSKEQFVREEFAPLSFWAWNDEMKDEDIKRQVREFLDQGFHGFFMHSRGGLRTPYFSDVWFHACRTAAEEAEKYGMEAWIYDEDGWPSGFAGGRVNGLGLEYQSKNFVFQTQRPENKERWIAAYRKNKDSYEKCGFFEGELWAVYRVEPSYADLLSKKTTRKFLDITYERYKKELGDFFGTTVPGFFTDEPQFFPQGYPYSFELSSYFLDRNGYLMEDVLYHLYLEDTNKESYSFLQDFWNTIQEMMEENFSRQIYEWCEENGVIFTGHYPGEDSLIQQMCSTAGVMPKYKYMQRPGIDHLGRRLTSLLLTKQVTSVAKQQGCKMVLSETFGCAGWDVPFEDLCYIWGWQAAAGINIPVLHIGAKSIAGIRKRDYPAFYSYQEPWWSQFSHLAGWMGGLSYKMARGKWLEEVVVISPMQSVYCTHHASGKQTELEREIASNYRNLCNCLLDAQVGFDIADETILSALASVENGILHIGNCGYRYVIVSKCLLLLDTTWEILEQFQNQGGRIIFTDQRPAGNKERIWPLSIDVVCNANRFWLKYFQSIHFKRPVGIYEQNGFYLASGVNISVKEEAGLLGVYLLNLQREGMRELLLEVLGTKRIYQVDLETLERKEQTKGIVNNKRATILPLVLYKKQSLLLEIEDGNPEIEQEVLENTRQVPLQWSMDQKNLCNIDYAKYSIDGTHYSEEMPIVKLQPELFGALKKNPSHHIHIKYEFINQVSDNIPFNLIAEERECIDILCNGISIINKKNGWYMDLEFVSYDITEAVKTGQNWIEIIYDAAFEEPTDTKGMFETEVNRFFYPVEPEAIYIQGDFYIETTGTIIREKTGIRVSGVGCRPAFILRNQKPLISMKDVTEQGLWFYRGNISTKFVIELKRGQQVALRIDNPKAALAEVVCNGKSRSCFMHPYEIELNDILEDGFNEVCLILYGTNRNLLGPHHHIKGENLFVGCNTFQGQKGYEDEMFNYEIDGESTWTESYSFVPFGCDKVFVITREC